MKLPVVSGRKVAKALERLGFEIQPGRGKGSHMALRNGATRRTVTIPDHRELDRGTLRAILRQADVTQEEFVEALK